ncbi:Retrovirus-related Pol polyprotein from transposon RE1 [Vitis vinifera]|uniref:Retrovirus-related Pol polyprotein from transposon RE1 n=1 Tax=Vitis vinifera TaxID=29760 RepID=A0A438DYY5_VITVI|nr:Retrovirus-related Pol polyprotein from transposon RE1 [Vitis vinifera]
MGQGYEDHLVTPEDAIPDVNKVQWKKIDAQLCSQDMDLSTYIGRITSLKEEFLLMPFTNGAEAQKIQTDKFFMVLTLIGLRPDLKSVRDHILASPSVPSLDDPLRLTLEEDVVAIGVEDNVLSAPIVISLVTLEIVAINYMDSLLALPTLFSHLNLCYHRPDSAASSTSQSITLTSSDYDAYLRYQAATSASVTSVPRPDRSMGKTIGIRCESQGLYHLTSPSSPTACISADSPLLIHSRLGHPSLSKFQKMVPRFPLCRRLRMPLSSSLGLSSSTSCCCSLSLQLRPPDDSPLIPPISPTPSTSEALSHPEWRHTMVDEMAALHSNGTWDLISLPLGKSTVGCVIGSTLLKLVLMVRLIALRPAWLLKVILRFVVVTMVTLLSYCQDCFCSLISLHGSYVSLVSYQLDIKNAFFMVNFSRKCIWSNHLVLLLRRVWFSVQVTPLSIWLETVSSGMVWGFLVQLFKSLECFRVKQIIQFSIIITLRASASIGVVMSQMKYALDILEETNMLECKPVDTPMDPNVKLVPGQGEPLRDPGRYRLLVGKLNYLTITRPDISFPMSVVSQFLQSPCDNHWDAMIRILRYIKGTSGQGMLYEDRGHTQIVGYTNPNWAGSPSDRRSTSRYCVFIEVT